MSRFQSHRCRGCLAPEVLLHSRATGSFSTSQHAEWETKTSLDIILCSEDNTLGPDLSSSPVLEVLATAVLSPADRLRALFRPRGRGPCRASSVASLTQAPCSTTQAVQARICFRST